jgi:hypothetical protein
LASLDRETARVSKGHRLGIRLRNQHPKTRIDLPIEADLLVTSVSWHHSGVRYMNPIAKVRKVHVHADGFVISSGSRNEKWHKRFVAGQCSNPVILQFDHKEATQALKNTMILIDGMICCE